MCVWVHPHACLYHGCLTALSVWATLLHDPCFPTCLLLQASLWLLASAGINLLWNPVIEQFPEDPESPGKPKVRLFKSPSADLLICRDVLAQLAAASRWRLASIIGV